MVMHVSVVGCGYVGTTLAACLAELGHTVTAVDIDDTVVERLQDGQAPVLEPGVQPLLDAHVGTRLHATTETSAIGETSVSFVTVQTPAREDGRIDIGAVESACRTIGSAVTDRAEYHLTVVKSTVIPGMAAERLDPALEETSGQQLDGAVGLAINPEFQSQGTAVQDFMQPDKLVFGTTEDQRALARLRELYEPLLAKREPAVIETGRREAAMIKYANNVFLAAKISIINELGNIAKEYDVDSYEVAGALGQDERIGAQFLRSGAGWGGSCFGKDTAALIRAAADRGYDATLLSEVVETNDRQPARMVELLERHGDIGGSRIAVLGAAFKPETDDIRGTRARPVIIELLEREATPILYDPTTAGEQLAADMLIESADSAEQALAGADGALVMTGWEEFETLDREFDRMSSPVIIDGRRVIKRREGIVYEGLTW
jgi:UDPglucose 6-dehydrogenase